VHGVARLCLPGANPRAPGRKIRGVLGSARVKYMYEVARKGVGVAGLSVGVAWV